MGEQSHLLLILIFAGSSIVSVKEGSGFESSRGGREGLCRWPCGEPQGGNHHLCLLGMGCSHSVIPHEQMKWI